MISLYLRDVVTARQHITRDVAQQLLFLAQVEVHDSSQSQDGRRDDVALNLVGAAKDRCLAEFR